jgi:hypothetical protein
MSKRANRVRSGVAASPGTHPTRGRGKAWAGLLLVAVGLVVAVLIWASQQHQQHQQPAPRSTVSNSPSPSNAPAPVEAALPTVNVAEALMVTVELDFGPKMPNIKEALKDVERRHQPEDGHGRTFAILDAYGEPTPDGKLHMSMHLSMEKPGVGSLVFRRTGEVLWKARIVPGQRSVPAEKNLTVLMDDGSGKTLMLDGSRGAAHVLDVPLRDAGALVRDLWPDGQEREFTFIYSACGCPVKAKVRRTGETTARTSELPVMFPDDPAANAVIQQLMTWPAER